MANSTQDRYYNILGAALPEYNMGGTPDLRSLTFSQMISRRFEGFSEEDKKRLLSPLLRGVAVIPNKKATKFTSKSQPRFLFIMRYGDYPAVLGIEMKRVEASHQKFSDVWFNTPSLNEEAMFILGTSELYDVSYHKVTSRSLFKPLRYVFNTGNGLSHLGGGETINGMWRTVKLGLSSTTRGRSETQYIGFLIKIAQINKSFGTKVFLDHMNEKMYKNFGFKLNTEDHVHTMWGQISGDTYLKAKDYWDGGSGTGDTYDMIRTTIYDELQSNGIERAGSKPGSYIWYNPKSNIYYPESLGFIPDYFTDKQMTRCLEKVQGKSTLGVVSSITDYKLRKEVKISIVNNLHKSCAKQFKLLKKEAG